jgi:hypothetical protein
MDSLHGANDTLQSTLFHWIGFSKCLTLKQSVASTRVPITKCPGRNEDGGEEKYYLGDSYDPPKALTSMLVSPVE